MTSPVQPRVPSIYLDYHASTPCDPRVVEAMLPYFIEVYANPSSSHRAGAVAAAAIRDARASLAGALGALEGEVVFTSGATESNNLAILGAARAAPPVRRKLVSSPIEHKSVLQPLKHLAMGGFELAMVPVESDGRVDLGALADLVDDGTALVSVQAANNEIGTIQPISEIAQIAHSSGAMFHCDAAQAFGRLPVDVGLWDVDLLSVSAHKGYGPKGVGALYVRGGVRNAPLEPMQYGGGQEHELRPGTLNVPGIVGFGRAAEIVVRELEHEASRVGVLRDRFEWLLLTSLHDARINGAVGRRLPGNSSVRIPGIDAEAIIANLPHVIVSTGSACTSGALDPSHVLTAIGLTRDEAKETLRVGIGRFTNEQDIDLASRQIVRAANRIRGIAAA